MAEPCGSVRCVRYAMVIREYRILRGETWDASFSARLGKAAAKLYRELYEKRPKQMRSSYAYRNRVTRFPCGIIEQAYQQLRSQGVPLVRPKVHQQDECDPAEEIGTKLPEKV
jgi:hypothetical protein